MGIYGAEAFVSAADEAAMNGTIPTSSSVSVLAQGKNEADDRVISGALTLGLAVGVSIAEAEVTQHRHHRGSSR